MVNSIYASKIPSAAINLLIREANDEARRIQLLDKIVAPNDPECGGVIESYKEGVEELKGIIGTASKDPGDVYTRFKSVDLDDIYRSAYFRFSESVHGTFSTGIDTNLPLGTADLSAVICPLNSCFALASVCNFDDAFCKRGDEIRCAAEVEFENSKR